MSAYDHALAVTAGSSDEQLALAAAMLDRGENVLLVDAAVVLCPTARAVLCQVIDPAPDAHRCAEEFKVLIENAGRALAVSRLARLLPDKPLRWSVVEVNGTGLTELWSAAE